jgi:hypothetical protein
MNMSIFARCILLSLLLIITGSCAKISAPTGGPRDRLPPVVVKSVPLNSSTNFRGKSISVTFDEYVVLDNITDKFMVSPPMKKKPRVFIKGKSVNVEFDDKLKDSTTYTFYFQDAIKDLNEGNILQNFQFVFSTGPVIDSLSVTGNVYTSLNLEAPEKTLALMYTNLEDSAVIKNLPDYISRVDADGYFRIDNVRAGRYRLYALKDDDNSKNYNRVEEEFAFMDSLIVVTPGKNYIPVVKDTSSLKKTDTKASTQTKIPAQAKDQAAGKVPAQSKDQATTKATTTAKVTPPEPPVLIGQNKLILFLAKKKDHYLTKSSRDSRYLLFYALSLPPDSMKFEFSIPGTGSDKYLIEESRKRDTIKVWLTDSTLFSQAQISSIVKYPFTDTLGVLRYKEDTIPMRFLAPRAPRAAKTKKPGLKIESNLLAGSLKPGELIYFKSETPLRQPDTTKVKLYELIETTKKRVPYILKKDSTNLGKYTLTAKLSEGKKYLFVADSASFRNLFNENSDSTGIKFSVRDPESFSNLKLKVRNCEGPCIIQMLNQSEKILAQVKINKDGEVEFPLLDPGFYRFRVIYDLNGDGVWTTGDFMSRRQPEPVSYYHQEIEIRKGFNIENEWDLKEKNIKDQKLREKRKTR